MSLNAPEKKKMQPRLIVVSAPSGGGKTTLCRRLLKEFPNITLSISSTTRSCRPNESDGVHYHFIEQDSFQRKIDAGEFAEWAKVHDDYYGTPKKSLEKHLSDGKHLLFDIDVQGAMSLLKQYPDRVLLIFINPPSMEELRKRLTERKGDSEQAIERRLQNAYNEVGWSTAFDYQITNDNLDRAYLDLKNIVEKECL